MKVRVALARRQAGVTLIEALLGVTLSLVLIGGVLQIFASSKETYRVSNTLAELTENGRFALDAIARDVQLAGHQGCFGGEANIVATDMADLNPDLSGAQPLLYPALLVEGTEGGTAVAGDSLLVRYGAGQVVNLAADMTSLGGPITVDQMPAGIATDQIFIVSDCKSSDIFKVTAVDSDAKQISFGNVPTANLAGLQKKYLIASTVAPKRPAAQVMRYFENKYEVRDTGRKNSAGDAIPALYFNDRELVAGVQSLQVQYGIIDAGAMKDPDAGDPIRYVTWDALAGRTGYPATIKDTEFLVSVRIGLLVTSVERTRTAQDTETYDVAGQTLGPFNDLRSRRVYSTTIAVRNRPIQVD